MASAAELRTIIREEIRGYRDSLLHTRANEAVRLAQAACEGTVALHRAALGLPPEPESDRVWSVRIRGGKAEIADAVDELRTKAEGE